MTFAFSVVQVIRFVKGCFSGVFRVTPDGSGLKGGRQESVWTSQGTLL